MSTHLLTIKSFLDQIKSLSFWGRIFGWGEVKKDLVDAAASLASLQTELSASQHELAQTQMHLSVMTETRRNLEIQLQALNKELGVHKERAQNCEIDKMKKPG